MVELVVFLVLVDDIEFFVVRSGFFSIEWHRRCVHAACFDWFVRMWKGKGRSRGADLVLYSSRQGRRFSSSRAPCCSCGCSSWKCCKLSTSGRGFCQYGCPKRPVAPAGERRGSADGRSVRDLVSANVHCRRGQSSQHRHFLLETIATP